MPTQQLIVYSDCDEVLVTTEELEQEALHLYFEEGDRDIELYDREIISLDNLRNSPALQISPGNLRISH